MTGRLSRLLPVASFIGVVAEDEALEFESLEAALDGGFGDAGMMGVAGVGEMGRWGDFAETS